MMIRFRINMNDISLDSRRPPSRRRDGFTIIELLAVVMIMAILGAIVIGIAGYAARRAEHARVTANLQLIRNALENHRIDAGRYIGFPDDVDDVHPMTGTKYQVLTNYVDTIVFEDSWGNPFQYKVLGRHSYELWSWGPTGPDEDYDIIK